ncbi:ribonuclease III [[Clostridium] colinum]|uniref:ribonuclease III n=1 Tax=[Clostridium] colinum TaxID=36835 RepID=UPI00202437E9|nr:ribonuclease III [[Clostridium] colinum]
MDLKIGYDFKDKNLLKTALTHTSFSHEKKYKIENNERLEFLGDAVLEVVISKHIFTRFSELSEGELTKLRASIVCEGSLAKKARDINIGQNIMIGKGEELTGGRERDSILADAFEAIIGAIYIDSDDILEAQKFILTQMEDIITEKRKTFEMNDCKTYLQEIIQKNSTEPIKYEIINEEGPAHNKIFTVKVTHNNKQLGIGQGKSKKDAEQEAAFKAIKLLEG